MGYAFCDYELSIYTCQQNYMPTFSLLLCMHVQPSEADCRIVRWCSVVHGTVTVRIRTAQFCRRLYITVDPPWHNATVREFPCARTAAICRASVGTSYVYPTKFRPYATKNAHSVAFCLTEMTSKYTCITLDYGCWRFVICFSQHLALTCANSGSVSLSLSQAAESIFA
jgi:hypothetical protein